MRRQLAQLLEETQVLSRLVEDLRTLALSDAGALPLAKGADRHRRSRARCRAQFRGKRRGGRRSGARRHSSISTRCASGKCSRTCVANAIRLHASRWPHQRARRGGPDQVVVTVTDTGAGIAARRRAAAVRSFLQERGIARLGPRPRDCQGHRDGARRRDQRLERAWQGHDDSLHPAALAAEVCYPRIAHEVTDQSER